VVAGPIAQKDLEARPRRKLWNPFQVAVGFSSGGSMRFRIAIVIGILLAFATASGAAEETPLLAHSPTVSKTQVVFAYGGYLWSVPREGGDARQLTTGGHEGLPVFSPDGKWIAFTAMYDGNADVFVMPSEGGEPRRLTWHR